MSQTIAEAAQSAHGRWPMKLITDLGRVVIPSEVEESQTGKRL
jgi:hypothetical protein